MKNDDELSNLNTPLIRTSSDSVTAINKNGILAVYFKGEKWNPFRYFTVGGAMELLIYLWILKDFFWSQDDYYAGLITGTAAVAVSLYTLSLAAYVRNYHEVWYNIGQFLWIFGNYWWMIGELYCSKYCTTDYSYYNQHNDECGYILLIAFIWLSVYYLLIVPSNILPITEEAAAVYVNLVKLPSPYPSIFPTWRAYENVHMLFWIGKDLAWNEDSIIAWYIFLIPTLLVAVDYVRCCASRKDLLMETVHNLSILLWVCSNAQWAICDFYHETDDFPRTKAVPITVWDNDSLHNYRWWASWLFILAMLPIALMHILWWTVSIIE